MRAYSLVQVSLSGLITAHASQDCRATPGSPHWPSRRDWSALNDTVDGRLLASNAPAAVCHPDNVAYDEAKCAAVTKDWGTSSFHADDPVSVMWNQYVNDTCLPDPEQPCALDGYPALVINATKPMHVKHGIDFARRNNIRVTVKNTGHDYLGRASASNTLSIWTHHMQNIDFHPDGFQLSGCNQRVSSPAVTLGAGMMMDDIFKFLDQYNQTIVGGSGRTVGIAGYVTGGGHSPLSVTHGLAADNVLEMELVTPQGDIIIANEFQNQDLFWAVRGGGGATFGVVTSVTMKAFPSPPMLGMQFIFFTDVDAPFVNDLNAYVLSQMPGLTEKNVSGLVHFMPRLPNPVPSPDAPEEVAAILGRVALQDSSDPEDLLRLWRPINETVNKKWPAKVHFIQMVDAYPSYYDWVQQYFDNSTVGVDSYMTSRLMDKPSLTRNTDELANAIGVSLEATGGLTALLASGKGVHDGGNNAVNPGWRTSILSLVVQASFQPRNETSEASAVRKLNTALEPFRKLSPDTGSYLNEAFPHEPDWQRSFWGENYDRLVEIKRQVDPDDVFWCARCVGNERWVETNDRLCRVV